MCLRLRRPLLSGREGLAANTVGTFAVSRLCYFMQKSKDRVLERDERGQDQPKNKDDAQKLGVKEQKEAAVQQIESPGEPASGE